ncbi:DUF2254 family protein [Aurantiacibacter spongiae]|uniref:DUF2254 family protein n=1 Tax=Aurantiacibacter spongiae TaxID=2488860 RepID=UPI001315935C|nr:DUF2254 family protein [Aurantiacibacter spongiae]
MPQSPASASLSRGGWQLHRIVASYWSVPLVAVLAALPAALITIDLDRAGLTAWIIEHDLAPVATADTAKDLTAVAIGVNAAFITLYFSITLLVLTVASSTLAVRLVDRWLEKRLVRVSLAGLSFTLVFCLGVMAAIDAEGELAEQPLAAFAGVIFFQALNIVMLTVALHDLGRTIFVDRSIEALGSQLADQAVCIVPGEPYRGAWGDTCVAKREGYVQGIALERLAKALRAHPGRIRLCAPPGRHVLPGEPLIAFETGGAPTDRLDDAIAIGDYRSDAQGAVFQVRLLVEIATRAMSPALNDFYTALAVADRLAAAMPGQAAGWIGPDKVPVWQEDERFELPGQDFAGLFENPLSALRQSAAAYPAVAIRLLENFARLEECRGGVAAFLRDHGETLARQAIATAQDEEDRDALTKAMQALRDAAGTDTTVPMIGPDA